MEYEFKEALLGGVGVLTASGWKTEADREDLGLYRQNNAAEKKVRTKIRWIPYYSWANRGLRMKCVYGSEKKISVRKNCSRPLPGF